MALSCGVSPQIDDPTWDVRIDELNDHDRRIFEAGFLHGHATAWGTRQSEVDALNWEADRLYTEMCRRPAPRPPEGVSYAQLCHRRGEDDRAERNEQTLREWFPELFGLPRSAPGREDTNQRLTQGRL